MGDLKNRNVICAKGILFLLLGIVSSVLLIVQNPDWEIVVLLSIAVWAFCRAYYFAFYVVQHYVDSEYRYAGLLSFAAYALKQHKPES